MRTTPDLMKMKTELQWLNLLPDPERMDCRRSFLGTKCESNYYESLEAALKNAIDWERIPQDSAEWFYFSDLLEDAKKVENSS